MADLIKARFIHKILNEEAAKFLTAQTSRIEAVLTEHTGYLRTHRTARAYGSDGDFEGEIQFTENTISGICVYQLSRRLTKPIEEGKSVEISCDFLDDVSLDELSDYIAKRNENLGDLPLGKYVRGILPDKLTDCILNRLSKDDEFASADVETKKRLFFAQIKAFRVTVMGHEGYDHAQCTRGGVALSEISDNMESKLCPGLFFAGEMVDVDGDCGGYNLQWAFSSGKVAGSSAGENA